VAVGVSWIDHAQIPTIVRMSGEQHAARPAEEVHSPRSAAGPSGQVGAKGDAPLASEVLGAVEGDAEAFADGAPDSVGCQEVPRPDRGRRSGPLIGHRGFGTVIDNLEIGECTAPPCLHGLGPLYMAAQHGFEHVLRHGQALAGADVMSDRGR